MTRAARLARSFETKRSKRGALRGAPTKVFFGPKKTPSVNAGALSRPRL